MRQVMPTELLWALSPGISRSCAEIASLQCWAGACLARRLHRKSEGLLKSLQELSPVVLRSCLLLSLLVCPALHLEN